MVGDAARLPFGEGHFDAVFTHSVLIYLPDHAAGVRELYRVLRCGGRASVFEPINSVNRENAWGGGYDLSAAQPEHDRIVAYLSRGQVEWNPMVDFDERELVRWFVEAGFAQVHLTYELTHSHGHTRAPAQLRGGSTRRPG